MLLSPAEIRSRPQGSLSLSTHKLRLSQVLIVQVFFLVLCYVMVGYMHSTVSAHRPGTEYSEKRQRYTDYCSDLCGPVISVHCAELLYGENCRYSNTGTAV